MHVTTIRKVRIRGKRTTVQAVLGLSCMLALPTDAYARYRDGMNLYQYVQSAPVTHVDPTGLWKFNRHGDQRAAALAEKGDTIDSLSKATGLDAAEYRRWITIPVDSGWRYDFGQWRKAGTLAQVPNPGAQLTGCEWFEVPNTVLAYWAGELGGFGKGWVMWKGDVATLKSRGLHVVEQRGWTASQLERYIQNATLDKDLHGLFFWGHGYYEKQITKRAPAWDKLKVFEQFQKVYRGVLTDSSKKGAAQAAYLSDFANWNPSYKLALGVLFACGTQAGRPQFGNNAVFWGACGTLWPHGAHMFGPSIDSLVPPGDQGTLQEGESVPEPLPPLPLPP